MLVRQAKNTFIRYIGEKGYITNQMTRYDRSYNDIGADFLREISRKPRNVEDIVCSLSNLYGDSVSLEKLRNDFLKFVNDLEKNYFLVTGETDLECDEKDLDFSYSLGNIKTKLWDYSQETNQVVTTDTFEYVIKKDQMNPQLRAIQFELTSRCNERCIHCYIPNSKKNNGSDMTFEQVCSIVDQFAEMGGLRVTLSGGEVFLHKDIIRILQYLREKDMQICILSNLIALKDVQIPFIKQANVSYIQASLYSMDPQIHDTITTIKGSQEKTKRAIEKLVASDIPVQISCPLMKANKDGYRDILSYAQSLQIRAFSDYIMMAETDFNTDNLINRLSVEETEKVMREIIEFDLDYRKWVEKQKNNVEVQDETFFANSPLCGVGINSLCITEDGNIYPCPGWQSMVCGNINNQTLKDIWDNSVEFGKLRTITHGSFPKCLKCDARRFCSMCLERNFNENQGDMFKVSEHFCKVAHALKKLHEEYKQKGIL